MKLRDVHNNRPSLESCSSLAVLCLFLTQAPGSFAQAPQRAGLQLEEVRVTAQRREQSLSDIAGTVSVIDEDSLRASNTTTLADLGKITSGVTISVPADGQAPVLTVRGVGTNRYVPTVPPSIGIFVDDVAMTKLDAAFTNLIDVERIEVIKGPQATLYGRGVSSGAISIITRKPSLEGIDGLIDVNLGNNGLSEYSGSVNLPLGEMFALRVGGYFTESEGQIRNVVTGNDQENELWGGRARLLFQPNDAFQAIVTHQDNRVDVEGYNEERVQWGGTSLLLAQNSGTTLFPADEFDGKIQSNGTINKDQEFRSTSLHMNWALNDCWTLSSITNYQEFEREQGDSDSSNIYPDGAYSMLGIFTFLNEQEDSGETQELRISYDRDDWHATGGLYYSDNALYGETNLRINTGRFLFPLLVINDQNEEQRAAFFQTTYKGVEKFDFTFGLRYSDVEREAKLLSQNFGGFFGSAPKPAIPVQSDSWDSVSGTLRGMYHATEDVSFYLSYDTGFKPGGFNPQVGALQFDEEEAQSIEAGMKAFFFDRSLRWNVSIYQQWFDDYQVNIIDPNGVAFIVQNAAEVEVSGIETDFLWRATEKLSFDGSLAYTDAGFEKYEGGQCNDVQLANGQCPAGTQDLSGERLNNNSEWTGYVNATYESPLGDTGWVWSLRGEAVYRGNRIDFPNLDPRTKHGSYTLYNARLAFQSPDEAWEVALWGKNLGDEDYVAYHTEGRDGLLGLQAILGDERSYGLRTTYRF